MKFASSIGVGEVVILRTKNSRQNIEHELLLKVVSVTFNGDGSVGYLCRHPVSGALIPCMESELEGDPAFDQEKGCYPEEASQDDDAY